MLGKETASGINSRYNFPVAVKGVDREEIDCIKDFIVG